MQKFKSRRRSTTYRTDMPVFRPSIVDLVRDARKRLQYSDDTSCLRTDKQVPGLGKCVAIQVDLETGNLAYTAFIKRYALHVSISKFHRVIMNNLPARVQRDCCSKSFKSLRQLWHLSQVRLNPLVSVERLSLSFSETFAKWKASNRPFRHTLLTLF